MLLLFFMLVCPFVGASSVLRTILISSQEARYASASHQLSLAGIVDVHRHVPEMHDSDFIKSKWRRTFPEEKREPNSAELRTLSLTQTTEDVLDEIIGFNATQGWWLVFEDDIVLSAEPHIVKSAIHHLLHIARSDGIASMGVCQPISCEQSAPNRVFSFETDFAKCTGDCTHAMAYTTSGARSYRQNVGVPIPGLYGTDSYAIDKSLHAVSHKLGGIWTAGLNFQHAVPGGFTFYGLFRQDRETFSTTIMV